MGQRFQTYVSYGNGENIFAQHLQWCWGDYAIVRADQLITFLKENIDNEYDYFRLNNNIFYKYNERRLDHEILKSLNEINLISHSIVPGIDLVKEQYQTYEYEYNRKELLEIPKTIKMSYVGQDNNDGALFIKVTKDFIKYAFITSNDIYNNEVHTPITARKYIEDYLNCNDIEKSTLNMMLDRLDKVELLSYSEIKEIFDTEYDIKLNLIN